MKIDKIWATACNEGELLIVLISSAQFLVKIMTFLSVCIVSWWIVFSSIGHLDEVVVGSTVHFWGPFASKFLALLNLRELPESNK